jgi:hypothetical protein
MSAGTPEGLEVVHHRMTSAVAQLAGEIDVRRDRVAVHARQVAAADQVPDHDGPGGPAARAGRGVVEEGVESARESQHVR